MTTIEHKQTFESIWLLSIIELVLAHQLLVFST